MTTAKRCALFLSALTLGLCLGARPAAAIQLVTSCNTTCTENCKIAGGPLFCTNGQGITLTNGADLDMDGYSMICSSSLCSTKPAVSMSSNNSVVKNGNTGTESTIAGPWHNAIVCNGKTSSEVNGIFFNGILTTATVNCAIVEHNVFYDSEIHNVYTSGTATSNDHIRHNYFHIRGNTGIQISGTDNIDVDHNLFVLMENLSYSPIAIEVFGSNVDVTDNIIMGEYGTPISGYGATFERNYCDLSSTGCASCMSAGQCTFPTTPFNLP